MTFYTVSPAADRTERPAILPAARIQTGFLALMAGQALAARDVARARELHAAWLTATRRGDPERAQALIGLARCLRLSGDVDGAQILANRALDHAGDPVATRVELHLLLAELASSRGELAEMESQADEAARLVDPARTRSARLDPRDLSRLSTRVLEARLGLLLEWGEVDAALAEWDRSGSESSRASLVDAPVRARLLLAAGQTDRARTAALAGVGRSSGACLGSSLVVLASIAVQEGNVRSARALLGQAVVQLRQRPDRAELARARLLGAHCALLAGRPGRAARAGRAALAIGRRLCHVPLQIEARIALSEAACAQGDLRNAEIHADAAVLLGAPRHPATLRLRALLTAALAACRVRRRAEARPLIDEIDACVEAHMATGGLPREIELSWAELARFRGQAAPVTALLDRISVDPAHARGLPPARLVALALAQGEFSLARRVLLRAGPDFVASAGGRLLEAVALRGMGQPERAAEIIESLEKRELSSILVGRLEELVLTDLRRPGAAKAERERWLDRARAHPPAMALLESHGLLGPRDLTLTIEGRQEAMSREEAELALPRDGIDLVVDEVYDRALLPDRTIDLTDRRTMSAALKLLARESREPLTRQQFYERLWRTGYDVEIHEQKVIKTLQRLRTLLGSGTDGRPMIQFDVTSGIRFTEGCRVAILEDRGPAPGEELGLRQREIVRSLVGDRALTARELAEVCRCGHTAIVTDLSPLVASGFIDRTGNARATRYRLRTAAL